LCNHAPGAVKKNYKINKLNINKLIQVILIIPFFFSLKGIAQEGIIGGLGASYELDQQLYGVNARLFYAPNHHVCFGPEVSYFPYQDINSEYEETIIDLNINAHYIFELTHKLGVYPLSGINYSIEKERLLTNSSETEELDALGLNYGVGAHYNVGKMFLFVEFKGLIGRLSDEFITIGTIFRIASKKDKNKEHEHE